MAKNKIPTSALGQCPLCEKKISKVPRGATGRMDCPGCGKPLWVHKPRRGECRLVNMEYLAEGREIQDEIDGFRAGDQVTILSGMGEGDIATVAPSSGWQKRVFVALSSNMYWLLKVRTSQLSHAGKPKKEKKLTDAERMARVMSTTTFTEEDFEEIARLRAGHVCLGFPRGAKFAPGCFRQLAKARQWKTLDFEGSKFRPADFDDMAALTHLNRLDFEDCGVGDTALKRLGAMPNLESLWLENTKVTGTGLRYLAGMPRLNWLILSNTRVSDAGLKHLSGMENLQTLYLDGTEVTDKGLVHLCGLARLDVLWLHRTKVTNEGILQLAVLPKLSVQARDTAVTKKGMEAFFVAQQEAKKAAKRKKPAAKKAKPSQPAPSKPEPSEAAPDPDDVAAAKKVLYAFFEAMNGWEKQCERDSRKRGTDEAEANRQRSDAVAKIFDEYCTPKPRKYGRPSLISWQSPPTYNQPKKMKILNIEQPSRRKIVMCTDEWLHFRYQFVVVKRGDRWLVDHKKVFLDGWQPDYL